MVRTERADHHVGIPAVQDRRGESDRSRGLSWLRLQEDVQIRDAGQFGLDGGTVRTPGDHRDPILPASGMSRSQVSRSSECPEPVRSCRNFGASARDNGQSLLPMPPAGITA